MFHLQRGEGVFLNVHRTTCTGAGGELPTAAAQARGGLFGPRCFHVFPSSRGLLLLPLHLHGKAYALISLGFGGCFDAFVFLEGKYTYPLSFA